MKHRVLTKLGTTNYLAFIDGLSIRFLLEFSLLKLRAEFSINFARHKAIEPILIVKT